MGYATKAELDQLLVYVKPSLCGSYIVDWPNRLTIGIQAERFCTHGRCDGALDRLLIDG